MAGFALKQTDSYPVAFRRLGCSPNEIVRSGAAGRQILCGIAAYFAYGRDAPPIDREALAGVSAAMVRRGPDAAGEWISADGRLGLTSRRLAIIDLTADAAQPMA
jgi:hypothetical protein